LRAFFEADQGVRVRGPRTEPM